MVFFQFVYSFLLAMAVPTKLKRICVESMSQLRIGRNFHWVTLYVNSKIHPLFKNIMAFITLCDCCTQTLKVFLETATWI